MPICARQSSFRKFSAEAKQSFLQFIEKGNIASIAPQLDQLNKKLRKQLFCRASWYKQLEVKWQKNIVKKDRSVLVDTEALFVLKKYTVFSKAAPISKAVTANTKIDNYIPGLDSISTVWSFMNDHKDTHNTLSPLKTIIIYT